VLPAARNRGIRPKHHRLDIRPRHRSADGRVGNATVTANEAGKKITVNTKTSGGGDFSIAGLLPGMYSIVVEALGLKS
jgi:hypothetical protein